MLEHLATAVVVLDADLDTQQLNPAAETLFSVGAVSVQGRPVADWLPGAADLEPRFRQALADDQSWTARELSLAVAGGLRAVTVDLTVSPLPREKEGAPLLVLEFSGLDRHLRITREEQRKSQQSASRALVRGLAHEIKNPLGGIRGAAQLLERKVDDADVRRHTEIIIGEVDRLSAMVDALLGPNRPPRHTSLNIHEVTERVAALIEAEYPDRREIVRDYDPSLPDLYGDDDQLLQALLNIVRNAMQATAPDKPVTIRTRIDRQITLDGHRHRQVVAVDVVDCGPGIDDALQDRIFFPLVTTRADGSGLGLSIAQALVSQHGGAIEFNSEPGHTVFTMMLPVEGSHERT